MAEAVEVIASDIEAEREFYRSDACPLSVKMILGAKPGVLAEAFAHYRIKLAERVPAAVTHYGLFRPSVPNSPMIKEAGFFVGQGGLREDWGESWEPITDAGSIGEARKKIAEKYGVELSHIYWGEK